MTTMIAAMKKAGLVKTNAKKQQLFLGAADKAAALPLVSKTYDFEREMLLKSIADSCMRSYIRLGLL